MDIKNRMLIWLHFKSKFSKLPVNKKRKLIQKVLTDSSMKEILEPINMYIPPEDCIVDETENTPFIIKMKNKNKNKKLLVTEEKEVVFNRWGRSSLHEAVLVNDVNLVQNLLETDVNVYLTDNNGQTPLDLALLEEKREIVNLLESYCL